MITWYIKSIDKDGSKSMVHIHYCKDDGSFTFCGKGMSNRWYLHENITNNYKVTCPKCISVKSEKDMAYAVETYEKYNPFEGVDRDVDVKMDSFKMVKVRKEHFCVLGQTLGVDEHNIKHGQYALREKALVDGRWESSYSCIYCMNDFLHNHVGLEKNYV